MRNIIYSIVSKRLVGKTMVHAMGYSSGERNMPCITSCGFGRRTSILWLINQPSTHRTNTDLNAHNYLCAHRQTQQCALHQRLPQWQCHLPSLINIGHEKSPDLLLSVESFISWDVASALIRYCNTSRRVNTSDCFIAPWISPFSLAIP